MKRMSTLPDVVQALAKSCVNGKSTATNAELAQASGVSVRAVQRCLNMLKDGGAISIRVDRTSNVGWVITRTITVLGGLKNGNDVSQS